MNDNEPNENQIQETESRLLKLSPASSSIDPDALLVAADQLGPEVDNTINQSTDSLEFSNTSSSKRKGHDDEEDRSEAWPWPRIILAWSAVAAMIFLGVSLFISGPGRNGSDIDRQGPVVWIDGKAYVLRDSASGMRYVAAPADLVRRSQRRIALVGSHGLVARSRGQDTQPQKIKVGQPIVTLAGEQRRVVLPDGSILYVNENARAELSGPRQLKLTRGEVFVDVAPRRTVDDPSKATFVIDTPHRAVKALGTKLAVNVGNDGTGVIVTQGKVSISSAANGLKSAFDADGLLVLAGEQLLPVKGQFDDKDKIISAKRATHSLYWLRPLIAAAQSPLVPDSKFSGGALICVDPHGQESRLSLRNYHVDVHIEDGFARTTIDQTYFNHENWRLEGTFHFPLPADASLSRLAMYVDGKLMEGGMAERDYARRVFESIVYRQKDPALLEWVDGSTFKMRVFPLEPREEKRIVISYTQKLPTLYGKTSYRFPGGHSLGLIKQWSFKAHIAGGAKLKWEAPNHRKVEAKADGNDLVLETATQQIKPDKDVVLHLQAINQVPANAGEQLIFNSTRHDGARYLMVRYRPDLEVKQQVRRRDWVFLFEASGNRNPLLARVQIDVIKTILENAEHNDTFNIVTAGTRVSAFASKPQLASAENIDKAVKFMDKAHLIGALDLGQALNTAQGLLARPQDRKANQWNPHLVHVGTGIPTLGERREDVLVKSLSKDITYIGVGVGKQWSRQLMKTASARTGGYYTQINPDEQIQWRAFELLSTLNTPRLLNVAAVDSAEIVKFLSYNDSVASGQQLMAVARLSEREPMPKSMIISGMLGGKTWTKQLEVKAKNVKPTGDYLPRTWAKLEIDRLLAEDAKKNKTRIVALSKQMYVMSPFTSLLVLENEKMYAQFKIDRGRKDHWALYPAPAEVPIVFDPDPANPIQQFTRGRDPQRLKNVTQVNNQDPQQNDPQVATANSKPTRQQIMGTIMVRIAPQMLRMPNQPYYHGGQAMTVYQLQTGAYGYASRKWGRRGGWWYGYYDSDGRQGMRRWATQQLGEKDGKSLSLAAKEEQVILGGELRKRLVDLSLDAETNSRLPGRFNLQHSSVVLNSDEILSSLSARGLERGDLLRSHTEWGQTSNVIFADEGRILNKGSLGPVLNRPVDLWEAGGASDPAVEEISRYGFRLSGGRSNLGISMEDANSSTGDYLEVPQLLPSAQTAGGVKFKYGKRRAKLAEVSLTNGRFAQRLLGGYGYNRTLYQRPQFYNDWRVFGDLLHYAPGMNTSNIDVQAILDAEARPSKGSAPGKIDPAAKALIDKARGIGWRSVTYKRKDGTIALRIVFDGTGRFAYQQVMDNGLRQNVYCDGKTLWHLYPDLSVGAKRTFSRFHHGLISSLVPWLLPSASDLARGADLILVDERTAALSPAGADRLKDKDGKPVKYAQIQFLFAEDGQLVEQQMVRMPDGKVLARTTYDSEGKMTRYILTRDGKEKDSKEIEKQVGEIELSQQRASAPDLQSGLKSELEQLVVLPMPLRTRQHVWSTRKIKNSNYEQWTEDDALAVMSSSLSQNQYELLQVFARRFAARGDRRIGFYTLIMANNYSYDPNTSWSSGNKKNIKVDALKDHPNSELAQYLAQQNEILRKGYSHKELDLTPTANADESGFLKRMAMARYLVVQWLSGKARRGSQQQQAKVRSKAIDFIRECDDPTMGWALLSLILNYGGGGSDFYSSIITAARHFEDVPGMMYIAKYERARALRQSGKHPESRKLFLEIYKKAIERGMLPRIDSDFYYAFNNDDTGRKQWQKLMRGTSAKLIENENHPGTVTLAWQCYQIGDRMLSEEMFATALANVPDEQHLATTLSAIEFLWHSGQHPRADAILTALLKDKKYRQWPALWRLSSSIAAQRQMLAKSLNDLEHAIELEYADLPDIVNLKMVRNEFSQLLGRYQQLANAIATLEHDPPANFVSRVIRAADRWRALDSDDTAACQSAARVLQQLGAKQLAWDYLTTPLADKPNEASPWTSLAATLRQQGEFDLADRAYVTAYDIEPTNAQILWDRAQLLQQSGRFDTARQVFEAIAAGQWQPRFNWIQSRARQYLGRN